MSTLLSSLFLIIMTILSLSAVGFSVLFIVDFSDIDAEAITSMAAIPLGVVYTVGCMLAVYFFLRNLSRLTIDTMTANVTTPTNPTSPTIPTAIDLNKRQLKMTALAARYLMLFLMAILSTILSAVIGYAFPLHSGFRLSIQIMDFGPNLLCIYLQFVFAKKHYKRCCGCCDRRCHRLLKTKTKEVIQRRLSSIPDPENSRSSFSFGVGRSVSIGSVRMPSSVSSANQSPSSKSNVFQSPRPRTGSAALKEVAESESP